MANPTPQELLAAAACYQCDTSSLYGAQLIELGLLRAILLATNPMADTSPQTLLAQASCFQCYASSPYMLQLLILGLLAQIAQGGGVGPGGGGQLLTYSGTDPTSDGILPTDQSKPAMAYKVDGSGPTYSWDTINHTWV